MRISATFLLFILLFPSFSSAQDVRAFSNYLTWPKISTTEYVDLNGKPDILLLDTYQKDEIGFVVVVKRFDGSAWFICFLSVLDKRATNVYYFERDTGSMWKITKTFSFTHFEDVMEILSDYEYENYGIIWSY